MYKLFSYILLICFFIIVGCTNSLDYKDEDIAAIVRGEEITIGELRFLYPDEKILSYIDGTVKAKLVIQKAKRLNIDVSKQVKQTIEAFGEYPPKSVDTSIGNSIREFAEPQAKKLGMEPEEYYEKYMEITTEASAYMVAYIEQMLGKPKVDIEEYNEQVNQMLEYNEQANELLNNLVEENKNEIEILIR